jgi:ubiquinone biosynthesis protein UbiJ
MAVISSSPFEFQDSVLSALVLGVVESSINRLLEQDEQARHSIQPCIGRVARIKSHDPYATFYLLFTQQGLQVLSFYDGHVDARINSSALRLLQRLIHPQVAGCEVNDLQLSGDQVLIGVVLALLQRFNLWSIVQRVLLDAFPQWQALPQLIGILQNLSPDWLQSLQQLPDDWRRTTEHVAQLAAQQTQMLATLQALRADLQQSKQPPVLDVLGVDMLSFFVLYGVGGWLIGLGNDKTLVGVMLIGLASVLLVCKRRACKKVSADTAGTQQDH